MSVYCWLLIAFTSLIFPTLFGKVVRVNLFAQTAQCVVQLTLTTLPYLYCLAAATEHRYFYSLKQSKQMRTPNWHSNMSCTFKAISLVPSHSVEKWLLRRKCTVKRKLRFLLLLRKGHTTYMYVQTNKPTTCISVSRWFWLKGGVTCTVTKQPRSQLRSYFRQNKPFVGSFVMIVGIPFFSGRGKSRWHVLPPYIPKGLATKVINLILSEASISVLNQTINEGKKGIDRYTELKFLEYCWYTAKDTHPPLPPPTSSNRISNGAYESCQSKRDKAVSRRNSKGPEAWSNKE